MIQVLSLIKDGIEQPQSYRLIYKDPTSGQGEAHKQTIKFGTAAVLQEVLANGGMVQAEIDSLFANAH
jgi:hypothetical protein